ncbi:MAG: NAD(P)/FAD-dependent oxidoreductase, partial [Bacteroidia bacterium]
KLYSTVYEYASQLGVKLYGGLEVKDWVSGNTVTVTTSQDLEIKTKNLILCTNAFTSKISSQEVIPCRGQVIISKPLDVLPCTGPHFYDSGYYYWRNIDNRILLGGARNIDFEGENSSDLHTNETVISELRRFMNENICGHEVEIEHQWSGIMGMGSNTEKKPIVKALESNVIAAVRLGGMGVALSADVAEEVLHLT